MTLEEGDQYDWAGRRIKLKSMELDTRDIPDMSLVRLKKARKELREIVYDEPRPPSHQIRALTLLNTEIDIYEN